MVIARHDERITWFQNLLCGGVAVILSRSATSPLEVVKVLCQVGTQDTKQGLARTFTNVYRNEGLKAFWKGNWMTCLRLFPYSALQFISFNYLVVSNYKFFECSTNVESTFNTYCPGPRETVYFVVPRRQ